MKRVSMVVITCSTIVFAVALLGYLFLSWRPATLRIAVGPPGSQDVKVIQEVAQAFIHERHYVRLKVVVTAGAAESAAAIAGHTADLAVIRADRDLPSNALSVAVFRKNLVIFWVPNISAKGKKEGGISKVTELAGHRVGIVGKTAANADLLKLILTESGVDPQKVTVVQFDTAEVAGEALRNAKLDAVLAVGPVDSKITADAISATTKPNTSPTFLAINAAEIIARKHPVYESAEIAAGALGATPPRPDDDVTTLSINHLIVARKQISEPTITAFTKQLFAIRHMLASQFPGVADIQVPDTDKAAAIPAHPGAAAYIDGTERTFLERYSDFMWLGLMALSGVASAGAWFRSYMRREDRLRNNERRARLLEMISAARTTESADDLNSMQQEADEILKDTLTCFENGAVDEDTMTAFNIALEQFHAAVLDRKMSISGDRLTAAPRPQSRAS